MIEAELVAIEALAAERREAVRQRPVDAPIATLTTRNNQAIVRPLAVPDAGDGVDVDPRRLVLIDGVPHLLDIRFRMLTNRELARAMGFDDAEAEYEFTGNVGEVTRQIGNAVACGTAAALVRAVLGGPVAGVECGAMEAAG